MTAEPPIRAPLALVLAPIGRDAAVAAGLLERAGAATAVAGDLASLTERLDDDTGIVVIAEEAVANADLHALRGWIERQPSWSDLPFIILTRRNQGTLTRTLPERERGLGTLSDVLGNVTFLERPFHPATFASVTRSALKGRLRQFEARARIEALHEGEERLRTALLAGRLGAWELDLDDRTLAMAPTCKAVFGRDAEAPFSFDDLRAEVDEADRDSFDAAFAQAAGGGEFALEARTRWADGSVHWAEFHARRINDPQTGRARLVGVCSDITARKRAEDDLLRLNETLEERVAERTAELERAHQVVVSEMAQRQRAEEQLRQSQKVEMIGQLTGGVAHDFNNLLMAVLGNLELLGKQCADSPKAMRLIDGAMQGARRGSALTRRLLAFARQQDLVVRATDVPTLVRDMSGLIERSLPAGIEVALDLSEGLPAALIDANQVELALLNLVVNARDAMPNGGTIAIACDTAVSPGGDGLAAGRYVRIRVSDTGVGMDAATLERAIEPFFSTKGVGKGSGLGLSMIHGLALQLAGALRLTSVPGGGTTAELWLPATEVAASTDPVAPVVKAAPAGPVTILFVDDDALIAMSTVDMMEDLGHRVIEASSGEQALAILADGQAIDLLVTDFAMPRMNGAQLATSARTLRPGLPVILATGYAELPDGFDQTLPRIAKPYQQSELAAAIAQALGRG